jgi:sigma-E factor negative regulatory protein RseC
MSEKIEHSGIITHIEGSNIQVQIIQMSACSSCHAKGACSASDMDDKIIDVESTDSSLRIGDVVILKGKSSMGLLAVLLAFVIPFMIILLSLIAMPYFTSNEAISAAVSLSLLIPYYIFLSFFNSKLKTKFRFEIDKTSSF